MSNKKHLFLAYVLTFTFLGCENTNASTPKNEETVKLAKVLKQTSDYVGKKVVIDGNYFPACSNSRCTDDFILKSGVNQIKVYTLGNWKFKSIKSAQPLKVTGILRETSESPFIEATIIEER
jgi:hypothetical protein